MYSLGDQFENISIIDLENLLAAFISSGKKMQCWLRNSASVERLSLVFQNKGWINRKPLHHDSYCCRSKYRKLMIVLCVFSRSTLIKKF